MLHNDFSTCIDSEWSD